MCGIFFAVSRNGYIEPSEQALADLRARGPDSLVVHHSVHRNPSEEHPKCYLTFASSVLSLRGDEVCVQPLIDSETGSVLFWNGEAWKIDGSQVFENDSQVVFRALLHALSKTAVCGGADEGDSRTQTVLKVLTSIAGPYAFVFYDAEAATIHFGRDRLGRRSLISSRNSNRSPVKELDNLILSSIGIGDDQYTVEVATTGVHCVRIHDTSLTPTITPWSMPPPSINNSIPDSGIDSLPTADAIEALQQQMSESLRLRVTNIPAYNLTQSNHNKPSKLAILFSGGLDCTLLARLCHELLPIDQSIDLLNVAFENPRTVRAAAASKKGGTVAQSAYEACPDRMTGRSSYAELAKACHNRIWRFVAIDVPYSEAVSHRPKITGLMRPHNTEMDLSIAMALYFASRGQGMIDTPNDVSEQPFSYQTPARVLLSGLGADELFGGYARHAAAFSRGGFETLNNELELDFKRIGSRNLGRDDRVMSHWAREVRYPFLDEDFVKLTLSFPAWQKCGFRPGKVIPKHFEEHEKYAATRAQDLDPAKMILRCLMWNLGMTGVAAEKKRAIQFGARTAKMEGGRTKGTDMLV